MIALVVIILSARFNNICWCVPMHFQTIQILIWQVPRTFYKLWIYYTSLSPAWWAEVIVSNLSIIINNKYTHNWYKNWTGHIVFMMEKLTHYYLLRGRFGPQLFLIKCRHFYGLNNFYNLLLYKLKDYLWSKVLTKESCDDHNILLMSSEYNLQST